LQQLKIRHEGRAQADECHRLMLLGQSRTEATILTSLMRNWKMIANQTDHTSRLRKKKRLKSGPRQVRANLGTITGGASATVGRFDSADRRDDMEPRYDGGRSDVHLRRIASGLGKPEPDFFGTQENEAFPLWAAAAAVGFLNVPLATPKCRGVGLVK
jgi:hypothetical protein